jgi:hypothetical protein
VPVRIHSESEALKPWRTEAYLRYVGVRRGAGNEEGYPCSNTGL